MLPKIVDLSHSGMGIMFENSVSSLVKNQKVEFTLKFDNTEVDIIGEIRHAGAKFTGIEYLKIETNRFKYYEYLDSKIMYIILQNLLVQKKIKIPCLPVHDELIFPKKYHTPHSGKLHIKF